MIEIRVYVHGIKKPIAISCLTYGGMAEQCEKIGQCGVFDDANDMFYPPHRVWEIVIDRTNST